MVTGNDFVKDFSAGNLYQCILRITKGLVETIPDSFSLELKLYIVSEAAVGSLVTQTPI